MPPRVCLRLLVHELHPYLPPETGPYSMLICLIALFALTQDNPAPSVDLDALGKAIEVDVAKITGRDFKHPVKIQATNAKQFTDYVIGKLAEGGGTERMAHDEKIAKMLGMIPRDMDLKALTLEVLAEQVGGFYDPPTGAFHVVEGMSRDLTRVVMAHEFTHALDDQYRDLDQLDKDCKYQTDSQLALHALAEGSAMEVMERWMIMNMGSLDMAAIQESQASFSTETLGAAPPYLWKPLLGSYMAGQTFLRKVEVRTILTRPAEISGLDAAWLSPPVSTEQIMHPAKYWDTEKLDLPTPIRTEPTMLPEGWTIQRRDVLGELMLAIMTTPLDERQGVETNPLKLLAMRYTNAAASGWDGDEVLLLKGPQGGSATVLLTWWDDEAEAKEFARAMDPLLAQIGKGAGYAEGQELFVQLDAQGLQVVVGVVSADAAVGIPDCVALGKRVFEGVKTVK